MSLYKLSEISWYKLTDSSHVNIHIWFVPVCKIVGLVVLQYVPSVCQRNSLICLDSCNRPKRLILGTF